MITEQEAVDWLIEITSDEHITLADVAINNGRVDFFCSLDLSNSELREISFKFGHIFGDFIVERSDVKDLTFLPKEVDGYLNISYLDLEPLEYVPALFTTIKKQPVMDVNAGYDRIADKIYGILFDDRVNGKVPREQIPDRINQLRDLDGTL